MPEILSFLAFFRRPVYGDHDDYDDYEQYYDDYRNDITDWDDDVMGAFGGVSAILGLICMGSFACWCLCTRSDFCTCPDIEDERGCPPIAAFPELFFDVTSASANWAVRSGANKVHAIGSIMHGASVTLRYTGLDIEIIPPVNACLALLGEILELSAIISTLEVAGKIASALIATVGILLIVCFAGAYSDKCGEKCPPKEPNWPAYVGYWMQAIYLLIVIVAASADVSRLLWLLPEIPVETVTLLLF